MTPNTLVQALLGHTFCIVVVRSPGRREDLPVIPTFPQDESQALEPQVIM
jgi:hypothetical protein